MSPGSRGSALPVEVLAAIAAATARLLEPAALYDVLREQVGRLVECDSFYLALWDAEDGKLRFVAHTDRGTRLPPSEAALASGPTSWVVRERRTLVLGAEGEPRAVRGNLFGSSEPSQSAIHAPMLLGDRLIGVLSAQSYRADVYDEEAARAVEAVAAHAAIALEASRIAGTTREAAAAARATLAGSEALRSLAHDLSGLGTLDAVVERGLQAALVVTQAEGAMIAGRPGEHQPGLVVLGAIGREARLYRVGDVLGERDAQVTVARLERAWAAADLEDDPSTAPDPRRSRPHRPGAIVPMRFGSVVTGVLTVSGPGPEWPVPGDDLLQLLQAVADQVAAAVSGLRLRGELLTRLDQIDALGRVAHALTGVEDADRTTHYLAEEGLRVFGAERAGVFLINRPQLTASCLARVGLSADYAQAFERQFRALPASLPLLEGRPVFVEQARRDFASPIAAAVQAEGYASATLLPLVFANETIGVLAFFHDRPKEYAAEERRLAVAFADQAALAIGKSRLFDLVSRSRREWQSAFDAAGSGLAILDAEGRIVRANRFVAELAGVPVTEIVGRAFRGLLAAEGSGMPDPVALAHEVGTAVTDLLEASDGRSLLVTATPRPEGGHVVAVDDVSHVLQLEQRYRALFATVPVAIFTLDATGLMRSVNPAARSLGGFADASPRLADFLVPGERDYVERQLKAVRAGERREFVMQLRRPDGAVREAAVVAVPASGEGEAVPLVLAIARDVTDEQRLREQLGHSEKLAALGRLVSGVAHELNNPLAGISALAQALILDEPLDEGSRRVVESIRAEATRAAQIVTDLLTFARQRPLRRTEVDLEALVREVVGAAGRRRGTWTVELASSMPVVHADADQIRQVILNLVANAEQAMPASGGEGAVRLWADEETVSVEVTDTGPGVAPDVMARIFEPFFTTKPVGGGTGLGLSISHGIIRAHGGDIRAENRPGGGARFWFELPRHPGRGAR
jgi:PAS domain S-box-containing protein